METEAGVESQAGLALFFSHSKYLRAHRGLPDCDLLEFSTAKKRSHWYVGKSAPGSGGTRPGRRDSVFPHTTATPTKLTKVARPAHLQLQFVQ